MRVHHIQFIHFFIKKQDSFQLKKLSKIFKKTIQKKLFQMNKLKSLK